MRRAVAKRLVSTLFLVPTIVVLISSASYAQDEDCLLGLGGDSRVADAIACLKKEIQKVRAARIPSGAVLAFDRKCPEELGWKLYEPGIGRFIISAGTPSHPKHEKWKRRLSSGGFEEVQLSSYRLNAGGGEELVTLSTAEMPKHNHPLSVMSGPTNDFLGGSRNDFGIAAGYNSERRQQNSVLKSMGASTAHNNMPPYIALYFCKKE